MRLYPELPPARARTVAADVAVLAAVLVFAWLGMKVHDSVEQLTPVSEGVQVAGGAVQSALEEAGDRVGGAPIIGGEVRDALRGAGQETGGEAAAAGRAGEEGIHDLAQLLGWVIFLVPTVLLVSRTLPARVAQVRRMAAAERVLRGAETPAQRSLLAQRAAFGLPFATLLRHTDDPLRDLAEGRLDPLVAAVREDAGLRERSSPGRRRAGGSR